MSFPMMPGAPSLIDLVLCKTDTGYEIRSRRSIAPLSETVLERFSFEEKTFNEVLNYANEMKKNGGWDGLKLEGF